ncbi:MAG: pilus assembly protein PilM [Candidatus Omnitrophica bacterium]|nr:pilus assembly protein PilM [Candidatus Omnitrophota bacterium]
MKIGGKRNLIVDIGSTKIRVIDLEYVGGKITLSYYNELDISGISSEEIDNFLKTEGKSFIQKLPSRSFYVSIPGRGVLVRGLTVPNVPIKKLTDILKYEVQQQIPFPLEVVAWKYQIFEETQQNYNVLLGAIKREILSEYISKIISLGIDPHFVDTDHFALINILIFFKNLGRDKCLGFLEIGANSSNLIIVYKEKFLVRSLTVSGNTITSAISETEGKSFIEAELEKKERGLQMKTVVSILDSLHTEIQNSIDYWRFTLKGPELESLYICGGSSLLKGFREYLEEKGRIPVYYFRPLEEIEVEKEYAYLKEKDVELGTVIGIGLRKILPVFININFLPEEIERLREFRINRPYIYLSVLMAGIISITPLPFYKWERVMLSGIKGELEVSRSQYEKYKPEVEKLEKEINEINGKVGIVQGLLDKKNIWLKRILAIGETLPSSKIYITSITPGTTAPPKPEGEILPGQPQGGPPGGMPPGEMPPAPPGPPSGAAPTPSPGAAPATLPSGQPVEIKIESTNVFTILGEVIIGDIRTAFNDFKDFVDRLSKLDFIQKVDIVSCEVNQEKNKIEFSLVLNLK